MFVDCDQLSHTYLCTLSGPFNALPGKYKKKTKGIDNVSGSKNGLIRPLIPSQILKKITRQFKNTYQTNTYNMLHDVFHEFMREKKTNR